MNMTLASPADAAGVLALYRSVRATPGCVWDDDYPNAESVAFDLAGDGLYLMKEGDEILAAVSVIRERELDDLPFTPTARPACEIARVAVSPARQGQGLARRLLTEVFAALRDTGAVHLLVAPDNPPAMRLYAALGFRETARCFRYGHDYIAMELLL